MNVEARALAAYLAGSLILEKESPFIFDCLESEHLNIKALLEENHPEVAESFESPGDNSFVYQTAYGALYLNVIGSSFKGYDSANSTLFAGGAKGNMIVLYVNKYKEFYKYRFCSHTERDWACTARCHECMGAGG
jgi:hypothetical protein